MRKKKDLIAFLVKQKKSSFISDTVAKLKNNGFDVKLYDSADSLFLSFVSKKPKIVFVSNKYSKANPYQIISRVKIQFKLKTMLLDEVLDHNTESSIDNDEKYGKNRENNKQTDKNTKFSFGKSDDSKQRKTFASFGGNKNGKNKEKRNKLKVNKKNVWSNKTNAKKSTTEKIKQKIKSDEVPSERDLKESKNVLDTLIVKGNEDLKNINSQANIKSTQSKNNQPIEKNKIDIPRKVSDGEISNKSINTKYNSDQKPISKSKIIIESKDKVTQNSKVKLPQKDGGDKKTQQSFKSKNKPSESEKKDIDNSKNLKAKSKGAVTHNNKLKISKKENNEKINVASSQLEYNQPQNNNKNNSSSNNLKVESKGNVTHNNKVKVSKKENNEKAKLANSKSEFNKLQNVNKKNISSNKLKIENKDKITQNNKVKLSKKEDSDKSSEGSFKSKYKPSEENQKNNTSIRNKLKTENLGEATHNNKKKIQKKENEKKTNLDKSQSKYNQSQNINKKNVNSEKLKIKGSNSTIHENKAKLPKEKHQDFSNKKMKIESSKTTTQNNNVKLSKKENPNKIKKQDQESKLTNLESNKFGSDRNDKIKIQTNNKRLEDIQNINSEEDEVNSISKKKNIGLSNIKNDKGEVVSVNNVNIILHENLNLKIPIDGTFSVNKVNNFTIFSITYEGLSGFILIESWDKKVINKFFEVNSDKINMYFESKLTFQDLEKLDKFFIGQFENINLFFIEVESFKQIFSLFNDKLELFPSEIMVNKTLNFTLFLYMEKNKKNYKYIEKGNFISKYQVDKLINANKVFTFNQSEKSQIIQHTQLSSLSKKIKFTVKD